MSKLTLKFNANHPIHNLDGAPVREGDVTVTIGHILKGAFSQKSPMQDPRLPNNNISEEEQLDRWMVALRVKNAMDSESGECEITRDEATKARRLIAERYDITFTVRVKEVFDAAIKAADVADPPT